MNKSTLFKTAHKLAKSVIQAGDNYRVTFGLAIKAILAQASTSVTDTLLGMGLKVWEKGNMKRIYMTCKQFNQATGRDYQLNDRKNKIFFDFEKNAIMRSYNNGRPQIEVQY